MLKFYIEHQTVVVKNAFLPDRRLQPHRIRAMDCFSEALPDVVLPDPGLLCEILFDLFVLIRISSSCEYVFFPSRHPSFDKLKLFRADVLPLAARLFAFESHSLCKVTLTVSTTACNPRLGEILDMELVSAIFLGVPYPEMEPLLMALGVCVYLHVHVVLLVCDPICLKQIAGFEHRVDQKHVAFVPLLNAILSILVL